MEKYFLYLNGGFKETADFRDIINPSTGQAFAKACFATSNDIEEALVSARTAFDQGPWPRFSLLQRKQCLLKIADGIRQRASELAQIETLNSGKPLKETTFMDIPSSAAVFEFFANNLEAYLKPQTIVIDSQVAKAKGTICYEPRGVTVLILPWNYPLLIACWKLAQALACGNTVILKPASNTPLSVLLLAQCIDESGLPAGVVNILPASGSAVGKMLCSDKRVDMVSFTGSNAVGKKILEYTASQVKKLVMELGGKSASVVLADADVEQTVNASLTSIFLNQGQMCTAMSRILVEASLYDDFVESFVAKAKKIKLGSAQDFQTQIGPLVSKQQRQSVLDCVQRAAKENHTPLCGGMVPDSAELKQGFFFEPTVFADVGRDSALWQAEIFGPVVCINKFKTTEDAIRMANDSEFALAACVWSKDIEKAQAVAQRINAGTVWVNTYGMFFEQMPYGGCKQSGFGKELGREGMLEYAHLKSIITDTATDSPPLVSCWYGF